MFWQNAHAGTITLPQASVLAARVDGLHDFLWYLSLTSLGGVTIAMLLFVYKYHRSKKGRETAYILGNHTLEFLWTIIPLILMLTVFAWGYRDYLLLRTESPNALEVNVVGRQWLWNFEYANGRKTLNELYLPKGRPVKLIMTAEDVLHSFYVPNFRVKQDVVPGQYTYIATEPTLVGDHPIYCAEFCGTGHSDMIGKVHVLEQKDFDEWLATGKSSAIVKAEPAASAAAPTKSPAERGAELVNSKGCFACHSADGTRKVGPSYKGIFGKTEELVTGEKVLVDENYIRKSLMEPQAQVVKGFAPSMPTYRGQLTDDEVNAIIAYIKSIK